MDLPQHVVEECIRYGVGRRKLNDDLFMDDKPPPRLGVYNMDDESLCHEIVKTSCSVLGCTFVSDSILEFENHYNSSHRYTCAQCKKILPSPHFLDLHIEESHDSFFAVMATRKPSFCCYIEECKEKFKTVDDRMDHCVRIHRLPKDFRYEKKPRRKRSKAGNTESEPMDLDNAANVRNPFVLSTSKSRAFPKYTGRKFTRSNENNTSKDIVTDVTMNELRESLPK